MKSHKQPLHAACTTAQIESKDQLKDKILPGPTPHFKPSIWIHFLPPSITPFLTQCFPLPFQVPTDLTPISYHFLPPSSTGTPFLSQFFKPLLPPFFILFLSRRFMPFKFLVRSSYLAISFLLPCFWSPRTPSHFPPAICEFHQAQSLFIES